jgi:hypothetical protein
VVACRGTSEEGAIPVSHLGYRRLEKEESRVSDSQTRELREALALRPELWSHGDVSLAPGVKLHREGFHKGPVDTLKVLVGNQRSRFDLWRN